MDCIVRGVTKRWTRLSDLHTHFPAEGQASRKGGHVFRETLQMSQLWRHHLQGSRCTPRVRPVRIHAQGVSPVALP